MFAGLGDMIHTLIHDKFKSLVFIPYQAGFIKPVHLLSKLSISDLKYNTWILNIFFLPPLNNNSPLYTPDNQIQLIPPKWFFSFLPHFFPLLCSLTKYPQIPISSILMLSRSFSISSPWEILSISSLIRSWVSAAGLCPGLTLVTKRAIGDRSWGWGVC